MIEIASTESARVRWADRPPESVEESGTWSFLFSHRVGQTQESGHIVVNESRGTVLGSFDDGASSVAGTLVQSKPDTVPSVMEKVRVPRARRMAVRSDQRYILLKKYEGFVTARHHEGFVARLHENVSDYPLIEAEFDWEELSEKDRSLAVEGASLVWTIGYRYDGSTRIRESAIYLRRLPPWTDSEIKESKQLIDELMGGIRWE